MPELKQSTVTIIKIGPFVGTTGTVITDLTIPQAGVRLSKEGGNMAQKSTATACVHDEIGVYFCDLSAADTGTLGRLRVDVDESGSAALAVFHIYDVVTAQYWDAKYGDGRFEADVQEIDGASAGVANMQNFYDGTGYAGGSIQLIATPGAGTMTAGVFGAAALSSGVFDSDALTAGVIAGSALVAASFGSGFLTAAKFAADALTAGTFATGAFTADAFAADAFVAATFATGAFSADAFAADALTAGTFATGALAAGAASAATIAANALGASATTITGACDTSLASIDLDHLINDGASVPTPAQGTIYDQLMNTTSAQSFTQGTDSLEAIRDRGDAAWVTGGNGGGGASAATIAEAVWGAVAASYDVNNSFGNIINDLTEDSDGVYRLTALAAAEGAASAATIAANASGASAATIAAACGTALNTYNGPTEAEMNTAHGLLATPAQVNTQMLDVLVTDTFAEPGTGAPGATISLKDKIGYMFKFMRNKIISGSAEIAIYNDDGTTKGQKSTISDDGDDFTRGEFGTGA